MRSPELIEDMKRERYPFESGGLLSMGEVAERVAKAKAAVAEWRADLGELLRRSAESMQFDGTTVTWWTFAGGRINQTLKYAFEWKGRWKVVPDNFAVKIQGDGVALETVRAVLSQLRGAAFWNDVENRRKLLSLVPEYRLSKFQRVLPDKWQVELVGGYLLDFDAAARVCAR